VHDLMIRAHVANFRCEGWQTSDGDVMTVSLPAASNGHFGRNCAVSCLLKDRWTVPRLVTLLHSLGIFISKTQVGRLLIGSQDGFLAEVRDVLRAGLVSAAWITVDDTGARHKAANGFCTQIGNAHFAWFGTTPSKRRIKFLALLRAGYDDYSSTPRRSPTCVNAPWPPMRLLACRPSAASYKGGRLDLHILAGDPKPDREPPALPHPGVTGAQPRGRPTHVWLRSTHLVH